MRRVLAISSLLALLVAALAVPVTAQEELGSISGTITDADSGEPIAGIDVSVSGPGFGIATTAADGSYTATNLPPGWYRIAAGSGIEQMESDWIGEYFDDRPDWASADQVKLDAGEDVSGIDLELTFGGIIVGGVTHAWTGEPIADAYPIAEVNDPRWGWSQVSFGARTDADGQYRIAGLGGEYRITLWATDFLEYQSDVMMIEPGTTTTHDIVLTPAHGTPYASVYGRACVGTDCLGPDETSSPLSGVTVTAVRPDGVALGSTLTDAWGWFSLDGLEPGTILLRLADPMPGTELIVEPRLELGPDESAWDVSLAYRPFPVHFILTAIGPSDVVEASASFDVSFMLAVTGSETSFPVTGTAVRIRLPSSIELIGHTSDGPFDADTGVWVSNPSLENPTRITLALQAQTGAVRISGEVDQAAWPDSTAIFGDGQGDDFAAIDVEIVDQIVGPPVGDPTVATAGEVRGTVFLDDDADGVFDEAESGASGIDVVLIGTATSRRPVPTDDQGEFVFEDVAPGSYRIDVTVGSDRIVTTPDHLLTLAPESILGGVHIGIAEAPSPAPAWLFVTGGLLIVAMAAFAGFGFGRTRTRTPDEPIPDEPLPGERSVERVPVDAGLS